MSSGLRSLTSKQHEYVCRSPSGAEKYENRKSKTASNASDSMSNYLEEGSVESNSLSQGSTPEPPPVINPPLVNQGLNNGKKGGVRRNSEWEILEGLKGGQRYDRKPQSFSGVLHKKRKWPLKGWHKRFFSLDRGILVYGKSQADVSRGKVHGSVDIGLSVISTKARGKRLDIDTEEFIYHLKAKQVEVFTEWVEQLRRHRLYRQHVLTFGTKDSSGLFHHIRSEPPQPKISPTKLMMESITVDLNNADEAMTQLSSLLEKIDSGIGSEQSVDGLSPNVKKDRRKFVLRKKKNSKGSSTDLMGSSSPGKTQDNTSLTISLSMSGMPESGSLLSAPSISSAVSDTHLASEFHLIAKDVYHNLKSIIERLKVAVADSGSNLAGGGTLVSVRQALHTALQQNSELYEQNSELRGILSAIREKSDIAHLSPHMAMNKSVVNNLSYSSSCVSEFYYDAKEGPPDEEDEDEENKRLSDTSSVAGSVTSEGSVSSEGSAQDFTQLRESGSSKVNATTGRRDKLPAVRPNTEGLSLWSLLTKNIGKDLSQVSMPVGLNEPLNMLQRLCEELEYSDLLDKASELSDPYDRMVYVAAFAVSAYGSSYYRAGSKPFNPLLGETYECIREDKGFKFIAEQVSHHPPVSACFCDSKNFIFSQDMRIKTKFWGKSMEFQPTGYATLILERPDKSGVDRFRWNKVTTCVHNLFSTQRWVDQYGELTISTDFGLSCKLTFVKASYWSAKRHEVYGSIVDHNEGGVEVRKLFGKWSEALYCSFAHSPSAKLIWRPGAMPEDYELYYGFTRFAIELNELDSDLAKVLPCTDTRFRPDQRLLEEGDLDGAEETKKRLEQAQRERRKQQEEAGQSHQAQWFRKEFDGNSGEETWVFNHRYWDARKEKAYDNIPPLW